MTPPKKHDWKKHEAALYGTKTEPQELTVPALGFFTLSGQGSPDGSAFAQAVEALYALSYAVRMAHKSPDKIPGWREYTVYPLEGVWSLGGPSLDAAQEARRERRPAPAFDKNDLLWTLMIRQPDFLTPEAAAAVLDRVQHKKALPALAQAAFEIRDEGRCLQVLHLGPFADEPATFRRLADFCRKHSLARIGHDHREIYLSDPRKTAPEKLDTLLRIPVRDDFRCD